MTYEELIIEDLLSDKELDKRVKETALSLYKQITQKDEPVRSKKELKAEIKKLKKEIELWKRKHKDIAMKKFFPNIYGKLNKEEQVVYVDYRANLKVMNEHLKSLFRSYRANTKIMFEKKDK